MNKIALLLPCLFLMGCEGTHDLTRKHCMPLSVPAEVVLLRESGLYSFRDKKDVVLLAHPRDTRNDGFSGIQQQGVLPAGTRLVVDDLYQEWGFDTGNASIYAAGKTGAGAGFRYRWGFGDKIGRAPWEGEDVTPVRKIDCDV